MKRGDDVFFFTLIDFLLQVFFFGLLIFVVSQAKTADQEAAQTREKAAKERLQNEAGISNIAELTDLLTRMVPLDQLRGTSDYMAEHGGLPAAKKALDAAAAAGGVDKVGRLDQQVKALSARISELEGGWGKASCLPNVVINGKVQPQSIAKVLVEDNLITLAEPTAEMEKLLARHGLTFDTVQKLTPAAFRSTFASVVAKQPECRYFLTVTTSTQFLEPMRAVWAGFRTQ